MKRTRPFSWRSVGKTLPKPDHLSKEAFPAYKRTPEEELVNVLMTGTTANTFYVTAKENVESMVKLLMDFEDAEFLAKATVYAREEGYMREIPIASEVVISTKSLNLFRSTVHRVCKNPHDWQKFIDICRSKMIRNGLGRALKREITKALRLMTPYHAMKYPKAVEDMINIARPNEKINPTIINYIKRGEHEGDPQLEALYGLKHSESEDEIIKYIEDGRLPYEVVVGSVPKMTPRIWEALLYQAPYFNLIRNLNNFAKNKVFDKDENVEYATRKIVNGVKGSMLYPFRFYVARRILRNNYFSSYYNYERIANALNKAVEKSVENVPELDGKVAICPDVSGSMSGNVIGDYSVLQCIDVVGIFTGMMIKKCKKPPILLPFETELRPDVAEEAYLKETILEIASVFRPLGGTSLSAPIEWLLKEREEVDYIIAFTDNEEWVGRGFIEALTDYINKVNSEVKIYLVTLMPYRDYPVPVDYPNVHFVFGWSDSVIKYIATDPKEQMKEIEKVDV